MSSWMTYYPRPQLRRASFLSLNGEWTLNDQAIQVPFPPQSAMSGYQGEVPALMQYDRLFTLPGDFVPDGFRVLLHIGAVDQVADVFVNGRPAVHHEGGYLPFSADITDLLRAGENQLSVAAIDMLDRDFPYGKQCKKPHGMWYTPVSGIWQSVWLEAVPEHHIRAVRIMPDLTGIALQVDSDAAHCDVTIRFAGEEVVHASFALTDNPFRIDLPEAHRHLWTPDAPHLYDMTIRAGADTAESYFALRTVDIREDAKGVQRICLNGAPVFLNGVLDQGYFPEGIFLPETPEAYEVDVRRMKELGFNLLRKHIKVESEAFYHACDRLGMLVMQDMVNSGGYSFLLDTAMPTIGVKKRPKLPASKRREEIFIGHALDTIRHLHNHPCVVAYTIFNEGWGQFKADEMYLRFREADGTRIWDTASGWFTPRETDVDSVHVYFRNKKLKPGKRPMLLSECGGYARPIPGHLFSPDASYGYGKTGTEAQLTAAIAGMYREMVNPAIPAGLCGVVYTQLSDVEGEINGLYTYDRQVCKVDKEKMRLILAEAADILRDAVQAD